MFVMDIMQTDSVHKCRKLTITCVLCIFNFIMSKTSFVIPLKEIFSFEFAFSSGTNSQIKIDITRSLIRIKHGEDFFILLLKKLINDTNKCCFSFSAVHKQFTNINIF